MYINKDIELPKNLPKNIQRDIKLLNQYYEEGKWLEFDILVEGVEASVKQENVMGRLTNKELDTVFRYFGWSSSFSTKPL